MSLRTTILTSAIATAVAVVSCGGGTPKKQVLLPGDAGAAGEAGSPAEESGGAGGAQPPDVVAGSGGSLEAAGAAGSPGGAGEGGEPSVIPEPIHVLFTVAKGAKGLPGSAVAAAKNPQSIIFGTSNESPDVTEGTNQVVITAAQLGLAETDTIDAFGSIQVQPDSLTYLFSVRHAIGEQSERPTRLHRSSIEDGAPGDVYASDGALSRRDLGGESSDYFGYNALVADETSLGLQEAPNPFATEPDADDLTGIQPLEAGTVPSEIFFSVSRDSTGVAGSGVAGTALTDRGCTIYRSTLNGKNSVAYTCAQLGLTTSSDVTAITVYGGTTPSSLVFAVDHLSNGLASTAVLAAANKANNIYASTGDGINNLQLEGRSLGLEVNDEIDALSTFEHTPVQYDNGTSCNLNPALFDTEGGNLTNFKSAHSLGDGLILVYGQAPHAGDDTQTDAIAAYDVKTCKFIARAVLPNNTLPDRLWTPVPLAGWVATDPLKKIEYWAFDDGADDGFSVLRKNAAGVTVNSYVLGKLEQNDPESPGYTGATLDYDLKHNRLIGVVRPPGSIDYERVIFPRPVPGTADGNISAVLRTPLPHPCAAYPSITGVDADGNSYFAQYPDSYQTYRPCPLSPTGEFASAPFTFQLNGNAMYYGMIVPTDSVYALEVTVLEVTQEFSIERRKLTQ